MISKSFCPFIYLLIIGFTFLLLLAKLRGGGGLAESASNDSYLVFALKHDAELLFTLASLELSLKTYSCHGPRVDSS